MSVVRRCRYCDAASSYESVEAAIADEGWTHDEHGFVVCCACSKLDVETLRARRLLGPDAPRHDPLPGQQSLFGDAS